MQQSQRPKRAGRPAHAPTDKTLTVVEALASVGTPQEYIARYIGISVPTLRKRYGDVLEKGEAKSVAFACKSLFTHMKKSAIPAIFYLKARAGWRDSDPRTDQPYVAKRDVDRAAAETAGEGTEWGNDLANRAMN